MIDIAQISRYKENNRIEAKKARGGLPKSIWETYSAFANTLGGIILLGVEELNDKSFQTIDLSQPEAMVEEFWILLNDTAKVSINILAKSDITIHEIEGNHIIAITIPRADRRSKPVYIGESAVTGAYRRDGEGDYHCTKEEIALMYRDGAEKSHDMQILGALSLCALDRDSIGQFRRCMHMERPGHPWEKLDNPTFLSVIGAVSMGEDQSLHPTMAGLLMLGKISNIKEEFPAYRLTYKEEGETQVWEENVFQFYHTIYAKITAGNTSDTEVCTALGEALANSLVNADYYGDGGIVVSREQAGITIANPGSFRIDIQKAIDGGVSDPRNETLLTLFHLINIGKREGSGIPGIYAVWKERRWIQPQIIEEFQPDRITLRLPIAEQQGIFPAGRHKIKDSPLQRQEQRELLIDIITREITVSCRELARISGIRQAEIGALIQELIEEDILIQDKESKNHYKLKI